MVPTTDHCYVENDEIMEKEMNDLAIPQTRRNPANMGSLKQGTSNSVGAGAVSQPRISFSADFPDEDEGFISLIPNSGIELNHRPCCGAADFEFRSSIKPSSEAMAAADELFSDGRMLPVCQIRTFKKLNEISRLRTGQEKKTESGNKAAEEIISSNAVSFRFMQEDDPSPRPPKCTTVLLREFLRFRKQRDSSSTSTESRKERKGSKEKEVKRIRKGLERSTKARVLQMGRKGD
nr:Glutamate-1-semialdehyde 2,1-aminomutase [Ipomoea batatas]